MTNYRILLLGFITGSWLFLCGLSVPVDSDKPVMDNQETTAENSRKLPEIKAPIKYNKAKSKKTKQKIIDATAANDGKRIERNEFEGPLDLSVPFKGSENADLKTGQQLSTPIGSINMFAADTKKKPRQLELDGGLLMSPEPQAEKRKSVDGAGIIINLKP